MRWLLATVLVCGLLAAQETKKEQPEQQLKRRVVVGTKTEESPESVPCWVSVVTQEDVALWQPFSLKEVLFGQPGVFVLGSGGYGYMDMLYLRGAMATQTVVLVDGVKVNDPTNGDQFDLANFAPELIESVEILRGAASALYGSDAIGGVVLIRTRRGVGAPAGRARLSYGRYSTSSITASVYGEAAPLRFSLTASGFFSENRYPHYTTARHALCLTASTSFKKTSLSVVCAVTNRKSHYPFDLDFFTYKLVWDENITNRSTLSLLGINITSALHERLSLVLKPSICFMDVHFQNLGDAVAAQVELDSQNVSVRSGFETRLDWTPLQVGKGEEELAVKTMLGVDYSHVQAEMLSCYYDAWMTNQLVATRWTKPADIVGTYLQFLLLPGAKIALPKLQLGCRYDRNSLYGDAVSPRLGFAIPVGAYVCTTRHGWNLYLKGSWGRGFRAPTAAETSDPWVGNPDLEAEHSRSTDIGFLASVQKGIFVFEAVYFHNRIYDMIAYNPSTFRLENLKKARIEGFELALLFNPAKSFRIRASFTHQDPRDLTTKEFLPRRSRNFGSLSCEILPSKRIRVGILVNLAEPVPEEGWLSVRGTPREDPGNIQKVDFFVIWRLEKWCDLTVKIENLLNRRYLESPIGPRANDRSVFVGAAFTF